MNQTVYSRLTAALVVGILCVANLSTSRADIIIDGYTANTNDRFTNNAAFIGSGLNFSGVGQASGSLAWGTAISRNVVISAAHAAPANTEVINFFATNDTSQLVQRTVISGTQVPGTDLYLAVLDSNLPASIAHYNFANQAISGPAGNLVSAGIYQNLNAYMFGRSPDADDNTAAGRVRSQAVGRNRITGYVEDIGFNGNANADSLLMFYEASSSPDYVQYEAFFQGGDSGGPMFVDLGGGNLVLLGTNAFIGNTGPPNNINFSGINYTGNQALFINNFINSVPEPGSLLVIGLAQLGLMLRRRRPVA